MTKSWRKSSSHGRIMEMFRGPLSISRLSGRNVITSIESACIISYTLSVSLERVCWLRGEGGEGLKGVKG